MFDDAGDSAVLCANDASVPGWIMQMRRENGGSQRICLVMGNEVVDGFSAQQRCVAGDDNDRRGVIDVVLDELVEACQTDRNGITRAALHSLLGEANVVAVRQVVGDPSGDLIGPEAHNDDRLVRLNCIEGVDDVEHHRSTADGM